MSSLLDTLGKPYARNGRLDLTRIITNIFQVGSLGWCGRAFQGGAVPSEGMAVVVRMWCEVGWCRPI